ncbi:VOC family protein [Sphingobacterium sp. SYP-B4668]|uniref:VOC family protein n=1 Tax=Sphingobacterium sp. SYP-B4668 TaxID=2996035 RepID=UPI0022DDB5C3|nr:VOC family protein [Sphingobacterium sp. SYP-B4668]
MIKFAYTILYVPDVTRSIQFYEQVFGFVRKFVTPEKDYAELDTGDTTIAFASHSLAQNNLSAGYRASNIADRPFGIELGIVTDQVEDLIDKVWEHNGTIVEQPTQKPWGQTVAYVRDVNGFLIEICSPMH